MRTSDTGGQASAPVHVHGHHCHEEFCKPIPTTGPTVPTADKTQYHTTNSNNNGNNGTADKHNCRLHVFLHQ